MRIICPNCRSEYEFDGSRVSNRGTKVKCSSCEHVFTVYRVDENGEVDEAPVLEKKTKRRIGKLGGEQLMLRQEGRSYPIQNLSLLQRWIVEKRVLATDEISIDGETWELVSRLGELRPFFGVLRQLRETRRELSATRERLQETLELRSIEPSEVPSVRTTDDVVANWGEEEPVRLPAATSAPHPASLDDEDDLPPAHTEESVDRRLAADMGYPLFEDDDLAPDEVVEPESAELVAHRTDVLVPSAGADDTPDQLEPPIAADEPVVSTDDPYPQDEPTLPSVETDADRVESGLFVGLGQDESAETKPDEAAESIPIPRAARETVSKMAAEEADEPYYDPAAQSVVTPMVPSLDDESTMESPPPAHGLPPIDFDSAMGPLSGDEEPSEADEPERLSGEESRPLDEPSGEPEVGDEAPEDDADRDRPEPPPPIDFDSAMGALSDDGDEASEEDAERDQAEPPPPIDFDSAMGPLSDDAEEEDGAEEDAAAEPPPALPAIDFDSAMGPLSDDAGDDEVGDDEGEDNEHGLGKDFDTFESSYEESFPVDSQDEEWEGDDFSHQFDAAEEDDERPSMLPYVIGAVVALVVVVAGAWYVIHGMKETTRTLEDFDATAETGEGAEAAGEAVTPEEGLTTEGDEAATEGEDALADAGEEPPTEAEPTTEEEPPTDALDRPDTIEEVEEVEEPPTEAPEPVEPSDDPSNPFQGNDEDVWDDEPDWGEEPADAEVPAPPADAAVHASQLASAGQHSEAIQEYLRAFLTDPNNPRTRKEAGWSYIEIGNNGEAAKHFRKAVLLSSMDPESHYGLGLAYEGMGRNDDAINEYETYLGLAPNGREAMEVQILLKRLKEMRDGS